ncbi:MAG: isoprenylcysteine carboxylmethyltransferase family protein [Pseudomonadota bacterium]
MSLFPETEIGMWNAWILLIYLPLHPLIFVIVDKLVGTGNIMKKMGDVPFEKGEKIVAAVTMIVALLLLVYSIFLPLKLGTVWLYAGLTVYLVGLSMFVAAIVTIAMTAPGQPFTSGMYRYSRHPMVIGSSLTFIGAGLASASLVFLVLAVVFTFVDVYLGIAEERGCLETYGDEYQAYLKRTNRWIGIPKSGPHS